jgi:aspartate/methionine/tyrosine aminotransferase
MPFPDTSRAAAAMTSTLFGALGARLECFKGELLELHVGDTWLDPALGCRMEDLTFRDHRQIHRYASPAGWEPLWAALVEGVQRQPGMAWVQRSNLLITAGCTGALAAAVGAMLDPGDEVLLGSPYWPLIRGIVQSRGAVPVDVPIYDRADDAALVVAGLEAAWTPRTTAIYLNSPNNPTGVVLPEATLRAVVAWARSKDLWILADEVYEHYAFARPWIPTASLAPERTIATHSFSKAYGLAGYRVGWLVGPEPVVRQARRIATHLIYNPPTPSQAAALAALERGGAWLEQARASYRAEGDRAAEVLGVPRPQGGTFLFVDVAEQLDERGLLGFLERCVDRGLVLAPGPSFGRHWQSQVRLCFTCEPPEKTRRGVAILAELLGR